MADTETTITRQTKEYSEEEAVKRAVTHPLARLKTALSSPSVEAVELLYKPYYEYPAVLRKTQLLGDSFEDDAVVVVDGMTGITRGYPRSDITTEAASVPESKLLPTEIAAEQAEVQARSKRSHMELREKRQVEIEAYDPEIVYKPLWAIELEDEDLRLIDANTGEAYGVGFLE